MNNKNNKNNRNNKDNRKEITVNDKMKLEIAKEIGLYEKIEMYGWSSLTARESGRIGGIITARKKKKRSKK